MRTSRGVSTLLLALAALSSGCATRARTPATAAAPVAALDDVSSLIRHGCYQCLEQAYQEADRRGARTQAFEAAALLVLRSKELGLPSAAWLDRAHAHAAADRTLSLYATIVDVVPPDRLSDDREALYDVNRRTLTRTSLAAWREALETGPASEVFRAYLDVALVCAYGRLSQNELSDTEPGDPVAEAPLYRYAVGICDSAQAPRLTALRAADPDYVEADYALGRYAADDPVHPDPEEALRRLQSAAAAFPGSPAIATWVGHLHRSWEEWEQALAAYDAALAVSPSHPEALIGRTIALSQLSRPREAIDAATRVIDAGQWQLGEAFYWRGWNQLRLGAFQAARGDTDRARTLMANARVFVLSGVIEWRLRRLESAERDFQQAMTIDLGECEAAFDLGIVRDELGTRPEALAAFRQARQCNDLSITLREQAIAKVLAGPGTDAAKDRDAGRHRRALGDLEERRDEIRLAIETLEKTGGDGNRRSVDRPLP